MEETKISGLIAQSLENIKSLVDANTVIGEPIQTEAGTTIIPVSKISLGLATGGMDYDGKKAEKKDTNFGGGGGTGLTVTPVAFIIVHADGSVEMMNVNMPVHAPEDLGYNIASIVNRLPEIADKIKSFFGGSKEKENITAQKTDAPNEGETKPNTEQEEA